MATRRGTRTLLLLKMGLALASVLVCLIVLEIGLRLKVGKLFSTANILTYQLDLLRSAYPAQYDPDFGWVPRPVPEGSRENVWGTIVTIDQDGLRSNGAVSPPPADSRPRILAVGDSFTFGSEVSDNETWPAYLEAEMNIRVLNAGVFGYGLDQAVLRTEALIPKFDPDILILGLYTDDIRRCAFSRNYGAAKPYFDIVDGRLVLKNRPTPRTRRSFRDRDLDTFRRVFGHSYLADALLKRVAPDYWWVGYLKKRAPYLEKDVPCLIFKGLGQQSREKSIPIIVVGIYDKYELSHDKDLLMEQVLECARGEGLTVLDLWTPLQEIRSRDPAQFEKLYLAHMSASGNHFVARQVAALLKARPDLFNASPASPRTAQNHVRR